MTVWFEQPGEPGRGYWDQALVEDLLCGRLWPDTLPRALTPGGDVVVVPGRSGAAHIDDLNALVAGLDWCVLVVTSDEERRLDLASVKLPARGVVWLQNPHDRDQWIFEGGGARALPVGYTPHVRDTAALLDLYDVRETEWRWSFAGQISTGRRVAMRDAMLDVPGGRHLWTEGFAQGEDPIRYVERMLLSRFVPCPGGPVLPDTFRLWEALLVGPCPLVDWHAAATDGVRDYWHMVGWPDAPTIHEWPEAPLLVKGYDAVWPDPANRSGAWFVQYRRRLADRFRSDLALIGADLIGARGYPAQSVTVVVTMSPIRGHPSLEILDRTIDSIRAHLPTVDVVVVCDGVRPEQAEFEPRYREACAELVARCRQAMHIPGHPYEHVVPVLADEWLHQAGATRLALEHVDTPLILFVEHDAPFVADKAIDWRGCADDLLDNRVDLIRFHHETGIHPEHAHLMVDTKTPSGGQARWWKTRQWSQRPHLARTDYYRRILAEHFPESARTMIEDRMHSVVQEHGWQRNRLALWQPEDGSSMLRTVHTDGRAGGDKYEMRFE